MTPEHLVIAPILIPFFAGAIMLFYEDRQRRLKTTISVLSAAALLVTAVVLLIASEGSRATGGNDVGVYLLGNWPPPFAITLVLDRLSALMLLMVACLALPVISYAGAGWEKQGRHFHSMLQFLLMGLNGAFLTGDLFNLFVFFEVMLAASYGLMLHGSGPDRIKAGLHYIAVNLAASLFFLIGVALVYGTTGTLNMADIGRALYWLDDAERLLFHAAAALLGLAFLIKAAAWPLCFWLPPTYGAASPPAAAIMAIMTKVGIYVILRLSLLVLGPDSGPSAGFGAPVLMIGGLLTMGFGMIGILGTPELVRKGGYLAIISSGTVLAAVGFAQAGGGALMLGGALYYLVGSTAAISAFFLIAEPVSRGDEGDDETPIEDDADPLSEHWTPMGLGTVEDMSAPASNRTVSWLTMAVCFALVAAMIAGLPPLPGFIGKFAILQGAIRDNLDAPGMLPVILWIYAAMLILSGLGALIALMRFGIRRFWAEDGPTPRILALEVVPVVMLLVMIGLQTVRSDAVMKYTRATALSLLEPGVYRKAVLAGAMDLRAAPVQNSAPDPTVSDAPEPQQTKAKP